MWKGEIYSLHMNYVYWNMLISLHTILCEHMHGAVKKKGGMKISWF